jgi:gliding motility-associated-like protein
MIAIVRAVGSSPCIYSENSNKQICYAKECSPVSFKLQTNYEVCEGSEIKIKPLDIISPSSNISFTYDNGGTFVNDDSLNLNVYQDTSIIVGVLDSSQLGCPLTYKTISIVIKETPVFNIISNVINDSVCEGEPLLLTSDIIGFDSYQFFIDDVLVQDSIFYEYTTSNLLQGNYKIKVNSINNGCDFLSDSIIFTVVPFPEIVLTSSILNDTTCAGTTAVFSVNDGFEKYQFYENNILVSDGSLKEYSITNIQDGTKVHVVGNNAGLCSKSSDTITTKVWPIPVFDLSADPFNNVICANYTVNFTITPQPDNYTLFNGDINLGVYTGVNFKIDSLRSTDKIFIVGTSNGCSSNSDTIIKTVEFTPTVTVQQDSFAICIGETINLEAAGGQTYSWSNGATSSSISVSPNFSTNYSVSAVIGNCESKSDTIKVFVDENIPVAFVEEPDQICRYDSVVLVGEGGIQYNWYTKTNVLNENGNEIKVNPEQTAQYDLEVTNIVCKDSVSVIVNVDKCLTELPDEIPQIITPNGDVVNDYLIITDIDYFTNSSLTIYNRWSMKVFEQSPYLNKWNGVNQNGNDLQEGTYFYVLDLGVNGLVYTGYIMIKR